MARTSRFLPVAVLVIACLTTFGHLIGDDFVAIDDYATILNNPKFNPPSVKNLVAIWTQPAGRLFIPVTYTVWDALAFVAYRSPPGGGKPRIDPTPYHLASLIAHILSTLVVFLLLRALIKREWPAVAGALLFALHPVQVESVAWASGLKDLLSGLFVLTAIWQYHAFASADRLQSKDAPKAHHRIATPKIHYLVGAICLILGTLSKPNAIVAPLLALTIDLFIVGRSLKKIALPIAPWLAISIACVIWSIHVQPPFSLIETPIWLRPLIAIDSLGFYIGKLLYPMSLAPDYGRSPSWLVEHGLASGGGLLVLGALVFFLLARRRMPQLGPAMLLFMLGLLPTLGFVPFYTQFYSSVSDHYLYIAMLGPALAVAWAMYVTKGRYAPLLMGIALVLLAVSSYEQGRYWRDDLALFEHTLAVNPNSHFAHNNLGAALSEIRNGASAVGRMDLIPVLDKQIIQHYRDAVRLMPTYLMYRVNLGLALVRAHRFDKARPVFEGIIARTRSSAFPEQRYDAVLSYLTLAQMSALEGDHRKQLEILRAAQADEPGNAAINKALETAIHATSTHH